MQVLSGVLPVLHTPYHANDSIDFETLRREIDYVYQCGAQGITFALASELLRLTLDERRAMAEFLCEANDSRGPVVISSGAESSIGAIELAQHAQSCGATALMAIPPIATPLGETEMRRYFGAILDAVEIPLVVQDASSYVGRPMSAEFQAQLWEEWGERVAFKPESHPVGPVISELNERTGNGAIILEGSGGSYLAENFRRGISGTMPGVDLLDAIVALWNALQQNDDDRVYAISPLITSILSLAAGLDGYLAIEKHLLNQRGLFPNTRVRGPVAFTLDEPAIAEINRLFTRLQAVL